MARETEGHMNRSTGCWRTLCAAAVAFGLCLAGPGRAQEKGQKDSGKGKDVIIIQLDLSKAPPGLVKQLMELSRGANKDDDKKTGDKKDDDKKADARKGDDKKKGDDDDDKKKGDDDKKTESRKAGDKKPNIVQVDLNKLPPDLAKRLAAELAKSKGKGDDKKSGKQDDDDDEKKGGKKGGDKDDDDDDKKAAKGKKGDDDDKKGGKKKDD